LRVFGFKTLIPITSTCLFKVIISLGRLTRDHNENGLHVIGFGRLPAKIT